MTRAYLLSGWEAISANTLKRFTYLRFFCFGLLLPLGFAPFHFPGLAIVSLALFYNALSFKKQKAPFFMGLAYGLGFFGLGVSWVYISIYDYGHLNSFIAAVITLAFLLYLSLFPATIAALFARLQSKSGSIHNAFLFSALWALGEFLRATLLSGFPWLLVGFGQFDTPLKFLLPIIGVFGTSFFTCFAAALLSHSLHLPKSKSMVMILFFIALIIAPSLLKPVHWAKESDTPISVGVIQANLSMRDKWDEALFWQLLERYQHEARALLGTQLIVMPESAIPLPASYIHDFIDNLDEQAEKAGSAILLGIPQAIPSNENYYFNTISSIGQASGSYIKQHLVPFGEYIPQFFQFAIERFGIPDANLMPGNIKQNLVKVHQHPIATLICRCV